ncbi:hypothetical protein [Micromonospora sp. NPDC092111]|uniref:COG1470 family protein n=1 Tax=Micromonospora sp. NPDC092111 TaxID=3364289 RepID=UPI003822E2DD
MAVVLVRTILSVGLVSMPAALVAPQPPAQSDFALTVSPSRMSVPADQIARPRQFTVTNQGRSPVDVTIRPASFAVEDGQPLLRSDAPYSAVEWVDLRPSRLRLDGGASRQVSLRIAPPATAEPGEHQVAVIFTVPPPAGKTGIGVSRSIGAPVYVTVPGDAVDSVEVTRLRAPGFAWGGPLALTATIRNAGTVHRDFVDSDRLEARVAGDTVAFPDFTLSRNGTRDIRASWPDPPLLCICRAEVSVANPDGGSRSATATVVILPLHLIGPGVAIVLALLLGWLLWRRSRGRRSAAVEPTDAAREHAWPFG